MTRTLTAVAAVLAIGLLAGHPATPVQAADYVLALSWQPAFCDTRPAKSECANQTPDRFDARNFVLHGLWPQPESNSYCNVPQAQIQHDQNGQWEKLPPVRLSPELRQQLDLYQPGTQSHLDRHEWTKHGTCAKRSPDRYFTLALDLLKAFNRTATAALVRDHLGGTVDRQDLCQALKQDFGDAIISAAGFKTQKTQRPGQPLLLTEIWLFLSDHGSETLTLDRNHLAPGQRQSLSCSRATVYINPVGAHGTPSAPPP